jgi:hypothetical protein
MRLEGALVLGLDKVIEQPRRHPRGCAWIDRDDIG